MGVLNKKKMWFEQTHSQIGPLDHPEKIFIVEISVFSIVHHIPRRVPTTLLLNVA